MRWFIVFDVVVSAMSCLRLECTNYIVGDHDHNREGDRDCDVAVYL